MSMQPSEKYLMEVRPYGYNVSIETESEFLSWVGLVARMDKCSITNCGSGWAYRGQRKAEWSIQSSFERLFRCKGTECELRSEERKRLKSFQFSYGCNQSNKQDLDVLSWMAMMQHYGVATRLIDFTESPFVALFMATREMSTMKNDKDKKKDFSVWAIYRGAYKDVYNSRSPLSCWRTQHCEKLKYPFNACGNPNQTTSIENELYGVDSNVVCANCHLSGQADDCVERTDNFPKVLWIRPGIGNQRLWAQAGLFLMPLSLKKTTMQQLFWHPFTQTDGKQEEKDFSERMGDISIGDPKFHVEYSRIVRFKFAHRLLPYVRIFLRLANIRASLLFPDIEGVAQEFRCEI